MSTTSLPIDLAPVAEIGIAEGTGPDQDFAAAQRGEPGAFVRLVRRHQARVYSVALRLTGPKGCKAETLLTFYGGQGSLNVNSWAPDSRRFAFVRYEEIK